MTASKITTPLDDARTLLELCRLVWRVRVADADRGVLPAGPAAKALVPIGLRLAAAVEALEQAEGPAEQAAAIADIARCGESLSASLGPWEGIGGLVGVLLAGVREEKPIRRAPRTRGWASRS